jgi:hypothetical protein
MKPSEKLVFWTYRQVGKAANLPLSLWLCSPRIITHLYEVGTVATIDPRAIVRGLFNEMRYELLNKLSVVRQVSRYGLPNRFYAKSRRPLRSLPMGLIHFRHRYCDLDWRVSSTFARKKPQLGKIESGRKL